MHDFAMFQTVFIELRKWAEIFAETCMFWHELNKSQAHFVIKDKISGVHIVKWFKVQLLLFRAEAHQHSGTLFLS